LENPSDGAACAPLANNSRANTLAPAISLLNGVDMINAPWKSHAAAAIENVPNSVQGKLNQNTNDGPARNSSAVPNPSNVKTRPLSNERQRACGEDIAIEAIMEVNVRCDDSRRHTRRQSQRLVSLA
jgi:hypothetical protein